MEKKDRRQTVSIFNGMGFYIALLVCVVVAGSVGYFALKAAVQEPEPVPEEPLVPVTEPVERMESVPPVPVIHESPVLVPTPPVIPVLEESTEPEPVYAEVHAPVEIEEPEPETLCLASPLDGETVAVFSVDELRYDPTLADWRTHEGLDIRAEAGTPVVAAADGTVLSVAEDEALGTTIRVDHGNGYVTVYASMQPEVEVLAGDRVEAGTVLGTVGNTALAESALGAHLHFALEKDGRAEDPTIWMDGAID